jgi:S-adenosylmethionine/arginine decarboxylase-like enzyme
MKAFGAPSIVHFGTGDKAGYTLTQLIETSNIMGHFVEETNDAYLDVFSCKDFSPETVERVAKQYFDPENITLYMLQRQALPKTAYSWRPIQDRIFPAAVLK